MRRTKTAELGLQVEWQEDGNAGNMIMHMSSRGRNRSHRTNYREFERARDAFCIGFVESRADPRPVTDVEWQA